MPSHIPLSLEQEFAAAKSHRVVPQTRLRISEKGIHEFITHRENHAEVKRAFTDLIYFYADQARRWDCQILCFTSGPDRQVDRRFSVKAVEILKNFERG